MSELHVPGIAILASGSGSTAEAVIHAAQDGRVNFEVGLVICSKSPEEAGIFERVDRLNKQYGLDIEAVHISGRTHPQGATERGQTDAESAAIRERIDAGNFAHVALMGYMRKVLGETLEAYGWRSDQKTIYEARMTNTHPGPLPETADTYGLNTSQRVLDQGLAFSAHTVHLVSAEIDEGPMLAKNLVIVRDGMTAEELFARVQEVEKEELPFVIESFLLRQAAHRGNI